MIAFVGVDHVQLAAPPDGEAEARAFYGGLLGLEEIVKPPALAARGGCWFQCGAQQIHIGIETECRAAKKAHPALRLADRAGHRLGPRRGAIGRGRGGPPGLTS